MLWRISGKIKGNSGRMFKTFLRESILVFSEISFQKFGYIPLQLNFECFVFQKFQIGKFDNSFQDIFVDFLSYFLRSFKFFFRNSFQITFRITSGLWEHLRRPWMYPESNPGPGKVYEENVPWWNHWNSEGNNWKIYMKVNGKLLTTFPMQNFIRNFW